MASDSEYRVLLWMLALIFFIVPLLMFALVKLVKVARNAIARLRVTFSRGTAPWASAARAGKDNRRDLRIAIRGLRAEISDSTTSCTGLVANISRVGICLKNVPEKFSTSRSFLSITIHGHSGNYRVVARPRWEQHESDKGKTIGVEIARAPDNWNELLAVN